MNAEFDPAKDAANIRKREPQERRDYEEGG
jgi:hypothetical protein